MKRNNLLSIVIDAAISCLMAIAGAGCLATAFQMHVDMQVVSLTALAFALLASVCMRLRGGWLLLLLSVISGLFALRALDFESNLYSALNHILSLYDRGYGWGVPEAILEYEEWDLTLTIQTVAAFCAMFAGIYLSRCLHAPAVLSVVLPVLPCIVVIDTVPSGEYLLLAILVVALLSLTHYTRLTDTRQANRLTALLLIPLILAGTILFQRFPKSDYEPPDISQGMFELMEKLAEHIPFFNLTPSDTEIPYPDASATVHLDAAGPRKPNYNKMLEVVASQSGALYLRGRSYMGYTGLNWEAWPEQETLLPPEEKYLIDSTQTIQIQALVWPNVTYFPYYPTDGIDLVDGAPNVVSQETYLYRFKPLRGDWKKLWNRQYAALGVDNSIYDSLQQYTQLPEDTALAALEHLKKAGVNEKSTIAQITERIRAYVTNSAEYNLNTNCMPDGETDFALWFLDYGGTGYCVHFASASAVLLRAAGIPARYVEGYLVDATAGQTTAVRGEHAHAWVEYYVPHVGWVILEATPAEGLPVPLPTEPPETSTTQPTEPTKPTFPSQPTNPTEPTQPSNPTAPTEPTKPTIPNQTTPPTTSTAPPETSVPNGGGLGGSGNGQGAAKFDWSWLLTILRWIGSLCALAAVAIGQWKLRLYLRRKWMDGREFVRIRRRWRYACMLARLCGHKEPKPLLELLKKAKFSRNGLNDRELRQFDRYYAACIRGLQKAPWPVRLSLRLIFAIW